MKNKLELFLRGLINLKLLFWIYIVTTAVASILLYIHPMSVLDNHLYSSYNNYTMFKQSFIHLITNDDLYSLDRYKHTDYWYWDYKYSPTFSVYMIFIAYLPVWLGLLLWNTLNSLVLYYSVRLIPNISDKIKAFILWFVLLENITAVQNCQSNALIAGLIILSFAFMEKGNSVIAPLFIALAVFIKPFAIVAFPLLLFYNKKIKFCLFALMWMLILGALPLLFISTQQLEYLYSSWFKLLDADHDISNGLSVIGILTQWFNLNVWKNMVVFIGAVIFIIPFINYKNYLNFNFRLLMLTSILIWVVIFNHRAESPTFIIAATGVAIWYFMKDRNTMDLILVISAFVLTVLSPTDLFPRYLRVNYVIPYVLKAVPCIFIWIKIVVETISFKTAVE